MKKKFKSFIYKWDGQKVFNVISFIILISLIIFYATRFIQLYTNNKSSNSSKDDARSVISVVRNNTENNYFKGKDVNNYIWYSNRLWRIIRINSDNSMRVVSDEIQTIIAYGKGEESYLNSYAYDFLNGTRFLSTLNDKEKYLTKVDSCLDEVKTVNDGIECNQKSYDDYVTLLSISDLANSNISSSYLVNGQYTYLINNNGEGKQWFMNNDGKLSIADESDIMGLRAVISINGNIALIKGDGSLNNPYIIEEEDTAINFGEYVKLDQDMYRVYEDNDTTIKLIYDGIYKETKTVYSDVSYEYNYTNKKSVAYYLNNNFYNSLSYKNYLTDCSFTNNEYGINSDFVISDTPSVNTRIGLYHVGDVIIGSLFDNVLTMSAPSTISKQVYTTMKNGTLYTQDVTTEGYTRPIICINKTSLKSGNGLVNSPWELK